MIAIKNYTYNFRTLDHQTLPWKDRETKVKPEREEN
jgi:hypothetical protein